MYVLDIASAIKKIPVNEIRYFIFEDYYKRTDISKENSYYSMKHQEKIFKMFAIKLKEKIPNPLSAKECYQSFIRKESTESVKQSNMIVWTTI